VDVVTSGNSDAGADQPRTGARHGPAYGVVQRTDGPMQFDYFGLTLARCAPRTTAARTSFALKTLSGLDALRAWPGNAEVDELLAAILGPGLSDAQFKE